MPPIDCITCASFYPRKEVNKGPLGEAPNKYCYRARCHQEGIRRGHVKSSKRPAERPAGGGCGGCGGGGGGSGFPPEPMMMGRDFPPAQVYGVSKLYKIHAIYGFRCAVPHSQPDPLSPISRSHSPPLKRRAIDPTRLSERERRNERTEADLYDETEFLVFGSFREDTEDEGFKGTRWLPATELEDVVTGQDGSGVQDAVRMLDELVNGLKSAYDMDE